VIEIHMFLVTLIRHFEFALPDNSPRVRRWRPGVLIPVVEGEENKGPQLPLKVTPLKDK
jgi:alkylphenol/PAH-inducible cytochrome P450 monooxygenase